MVEDNALKEFTKGRRFLNNACINCFFYETYRDGFGDCFVHAEKHEGITLVNCTDTCEDFEPK